MLVPYKIRKLGSFENAFPVKIKMLTAGQYPLALPQTSFRK